MNAIERTANLRLALERLDNAGKLRAAENLREEAISILEPITPPGYDLKNFDHAVVFWLESRHPPLDWLELLHPPILESMPIQNARDLLNGYIEPFRGAFDLLRACTGALETGKGEQLNINWICDSYTRIGAAKERETLLEDYLPKAEIKRHLIELLSRCDDVEAGEAHQRLTPQTIKTQRQPQQTIDKNDAQKKKGNFFRQTGIFWKVGYEGKMGIIPNIDGISYIVTLIEKHGNSVSCQELYQAVSGKVLDNIMSEGAAIDEGLNIRSDKQVKNDPQAQQSYKNRYIELSSQYKNIQNTPEGNILRDEIENEMEKVMACLKEKAFVDPNHKKAQANIKKRLNKAYEDINKMGMNELAEYLRDHIKSDGAYGLSYLGAATWEIIK